MTEEWFDVVDEKDQVIRQATRQEVHRQKWRHRAIHILVMQNKGDKDENLFLQKRALTKDFHPGKWDSSCSGHLDAGEDYERAAQRELQEELGLTLPVTTLEFLTYLPASNITDWEFIKIFRVYHPGPFQLNANEISEGQFFKISHIQTWIEQKPEDFATAFRTLFQLHYPKK